MRSWPFRPAGSGWTEQSGRWLLSGRSRRWWPGWAVCVGGGTLTVFGLTVEVADWHRFPGATIAVYLGLVPAEYSSGDRRAQGSITKTGNSNARRLLVESAWRPPEALSAQS